MRKRYSKYTFVENIKNKVRSLFFQKRKNELPPAQEQHSTSRQEEWRKSHVVSKLIETPQNSSEMEKKSKECDENEEHSMLDD